MKTEKKNQIDLRSRFPKTSGAFMDFQRGIQRMFSGFPAFEGFDFAKNFAPACDLVETEQGYSLTADLPGVKLEDVRIEVQDRDLVISGESHQEKRESKKSDRVIERHYGSFRRSLTLPTEVDADDIHASFQDGVLKVEIPKAKKASSKRIPIQEKKSPALSNGNPSGRWETEAKNVSDSHH